MWQVSARGGEPGLLLEQEPNSGFKEPHFLPADGGRKAIVYTAGTFREPTLEVLDLETGERKALGPGLQAAYAASGHLVYQSPEARLSAMPISITTLAATGDPFPVAVSGQYPSVSQDGTLTYTSTLHSLRRAVVRDRAGRTVRAVGGSNEPFSAARTPRVSADGRLAALIVEGDVWVYDLNRDIGARLTTHASATQPAWFPSQHSLTYVLGGRRLMTQVADGSGGA